jgi:hypothetical protein
LAVKLLKIALTTLEHHKQIWILYTECSEYDQNVGWSSITIFKFKTVVWRPCWSHALKERIWSQYESDLLLPIAAQLLICRSCLKSSIAKKTSVTEVADSLLMENFVDSCNCLMCILKTKTHKEMPLEHSAARRNQ